MKRVFIIMGYFLTIMMSMEVYSQVIKNPSHVYQQTQRIVREVNILRDHLNVTEKARVPGVQVKKEPIHVYSKSLELLEKIARAQVQQGLPAVKVGAIPIRAISPTEVFKSTEVILSEIDRLKKKLNISGKIKEPAFIDGKTPSDVYKNMWKASYLMDGVVGHISPSHVFRNTSYIINELHLIAERKGLTLRAQERAEVVGKTPKDVILQAFKGMYVLIDLEKELGLSPMRLPSFPSGEITPSDVFNATNMILVEMVRIKVKLGITTELAEVMLVEDKKPSMVLVKMQLIESNLKELLKGF